MTYISPAANREAAVSVKPISPKREFEQLIRSIRTIAANSRAFSGNLIQELIKETSSSAESQKRWSWGGSAAQLGIPVAAGASIAAAWVIGMVDAERVGQALQIGSKIGDVAQAACSATQYGYQATSQKIQQSLSHYNTFDQRMQSLIQSIDSAQQRLQQKEMEEASNR